MTYDPTRYPEYARTRYAKKRPSPSGSQKHYRAPRQSSSSFSNLMFVAVSVLALCIIAFVVVGGLSKFSVSPISSQKSTPQSEWTKGSMPALYQDEDPWKDHPYAGNTFSESGCGPISLAMVNIFLTGDNQTSPISIADYATSNGYASDEGTAWSFMIEGAAYLGLHGEEIAFTEDIVHARLSQGNPIICIMGKGDFTTTGHFIVLAGIDPSGNITIRDSNSVDRTAKTWDFDTIRKQCLGAWAYSI